MNDPVRPDPSNLVGLIQIADIMGVRVNTVASWVQRYPDFPQPLVRTHPTAPVWWLPDVLAWCKSTGRTPKGPA